MLSEENGEQSKHISAETAMRNNNVDRPLTDSF